MYREVFPKQGVGAEVGVWFGENAHALLDETQPRELHLIDRWWGRSVQQAVAEVMKPYPWVHLHRCFSHETVFPDNYFDWVYVDANHSYKFVKRDLEFYLPKVKPGGILAGHDLVSKDKLKGSPHPGVWKAFWEIVHTGACQPICFTSEYTRSFALRKC